MVGKSRGAALAIAGLLAWAGGLGAAPASAQDGRIVIGDYSTDDGAGSMSFVDPADGGRELLSANDAPAGAPLFDGVGQVDVEPAGTLVTTNWHGEALLRVDPVTGVRSVVSSVSVGEGPGLNSPWGVTVAPGGDILVTDLGEAAVFRVDPVTGDREIVSSDTVGSGPEFECPWATVVDDTGDILVVDQCIGADGDGGVLRVDPVTGDRTVVSSNAVGTGTPFSDPYSITRETDGDLIVGEYGSSPEPSFLLRVDPVTGDREVLSSATVGSGPGFSHVSDVQVDADGSILVTDIGPDVDESVADGVVFRVDPGTGDRTVITDMATDDDPPLQDPYGIAVFPAPPSGEYAEEVLADDPAGYWRLGEASGTTAMDSSGNGNDGTYFGGALLGQLGVLPDDTAARFDGTDDHVRVPDSSTLDLGSSFTAEAWIQRTSTTKAHQLFNKGGNGLHVVVMGGTGQVFLRKANVTTIAQSTGGIPADGAFHHVVVTMDGAGTARIYIDGNEDTVQVSAVHTIADTATQLILGGTATTPAVLDELALYDRALTPDEVVAHHVAAVGSIG